MPKATFFNTYSHFGQNFGRFFLRRPMMLGCTERKSPGKWAMKLFLKYSNLCDHDTSWSQTDRWLAISTAHSAHHRVVAKTKTRTVTVPVLKLCVWKTEVLPRWEVGQMCHPTKFSSSKAKARCTLAECPAWTHGQGTRPRCPAVIFGDLASPQQPPGRPGRTSDLSCEKACCAMLFHRPGRASGQCAPVTRVSRPEGWAMDQSKFDVHLLPPWNQHGTKLPGMDGRGDAWGLTAGMGFLRRSNKPLSTS